MCDNEIDISDRAEFIVITLRTVINNLESEFRMTLLILCTPRLEIGDKFVVGHDVNHSQIRDAHEVVDQPFDDRFAADFQEWLRFVQRQWVKASCVSCS